VEYAGNQVFFVGEIPAKLDTATGRVSATWDWKIFTVGAGDKQCAVFHTLQGDGGTIVFDVMYYKPGSVPYHATGIYSIQTGRWSLYSAGDDIAAEISKGPDVTWIVPMVQNADGVLVETVVADCIGSLFYTTDTSRLPITVQFQPKIWKGLDIFVGLKLGATDSLRKVLTTTALQKTAGGRRSGTSLGARVRVHSRTGCGPAAACASQDRAVTRKRCR